jgi:hypothetical protein
MTEANLSREERLALGKTPCTEHCSSCEGSDHHWDFFGEQDKDREPLYSCKHCEAIKPMEDDC